MDDRWKTQLRRQASARHMCEENRLALEAVSSKEEAVALYLKTIDWALEEGYPRLDTLREYFADCEPYGVYIDRHFNGTLFLDKKVYVFHHCSGKIRVGLNRSKSIIPMIYLANGCNLEGNTAWLKVCRVGNASSFHYSLDGQKKSVKNLRSGI